MMPSKLWTALRRRLCHLLRDVGKLIVGSAQLRFQILAFLLNSFHFRLRSCILQTLALDKALQDFELLVQ